MSPLEASIRNLAERVSTLKSRVTTEEATKTSFVLPFLQMLGYDIFNPMEVVPEYDAVRGIKKGEKVDYCILLDDKPAIIIECKVWSEKLAPHDSQLFRYFHTTDSRIAIITNGIVYRFYSDLVEANKMDEQPFFELDLLDLKDENIRELEKFTKEQFNIEKILSNAEDLKLTAAIKNLFHEQISAPSEAFIKFFVSNLYQGKLNAKVVEKFATMVPKALQSYLKESLRQALRNALNGSYSAIPEPVVPSNAGTEVSNSETEEANKVEKDPIVTTAEEMEGFFIVKSIIRTELASNRIYYRDAQSYFAIFADNNNRKPIARLYFNGKKKSVGYFSADGSKAETKVFIDSLDDIYALAPQLHEIAKTYAT